LLSFRWGEDLVISFAEDEHAIWWHSDGVCTLRVVAINPAEMPKVSGTLSVKGADGQPIPAAPAPPLAWDESFRYFRMSQATDDLMDAYRSMYLALESILSDIRPKARQEGEGAWLAAAFAAAASLVPLAQHVPPNVGDAVTFLKDELYAAQRNQVFHSKRAQATALPFDDAGRGLLAERFRRLSYLYLDLAQRRTGINRSRTSWSVAITRAFLGAGVNGDLYVTTDAAASDLSARHRPLGAASLRLDAVVLPATDDDEHVALLGSHDAIADTFAHAIRRIAVLRADGEVLASYEMGADLLPSGIDRFEAKIGWRANNRRDLRMRFES